VALSLTHIVVGGLEDSVTTCCKNTGIYVPRMLLTSLPWVVMVEAHGLAKAAHQSVAMARKLPKTDFLSKKKRG
jgi:hypothetical protein